MAPQKLSKAIRSTRARRDHSFSPSYIITYIIELIITTYLGINTASSHYKELNTNNLKWSLVISYKIYVIKQLKTSRWKPQMCRICFIRNVYFYENDGHTFVKEAIQNLSRHSNLEISKYWNQFNLTMLIIEFR